jgi:hypothetical protein
MGISVHNGYEKPPQWGYIFGVFSGVNARASHAVGLAEFYDVEIVNPSDLSESNPRAGFHPEILIHVICNSAGIRAKSVNSTSQTGLGYSFGLSGAWDMEPDPEQDLPVRLSAETLLSYKKLKLAGVGYVGYAKIGDKIEADPVLLGFLAQADYRINRQLEISARYALVDFQEILTESDELMAIREYNPNAGQLLWDEECTVGFSIYIMEHFLKLQSDFSRLQKTKRKDIITDYTWRTQFQLAF